MSAGGAAAPGGAAAAAAAMPPLLPPPLPLPGAPAAPAAARPRAQRAVSSVMSQSLQTVAEAAGSGLAYPLNLNFGNTVYDLLNTMISGDSNTASTVTGTALIGAKGASVIGGTSLTIIITTSLLITYQLFRCLNAQYEQYAEEVYMVQKYMTILTRINNYIQIINKTSELYKFEFPTGDISDQLIELTAMCANLFTEREKVGLLEQRLNADYNPVFVQGADGEAPKYTMRDIVPEPGASRFSRAKHATSKFVRASAVHAGNAVAGTAKSIAKFGYRTWDILSNLRVVVFPKNEWLAIFNEKLIELNSNYSITVSEYQTMLNVQQQISSPVNNTERARIIQNTRAYQCMLISTLFSSLLKLRRQFSACVMSSNSMGCKELMDAGPTGTTRLTKMQRLKAYLLRIREPKDISVFETAISVALHKISISLNEINRDLNNETYPISMVQFSIKFQEIFSLAYQTIRGEVEMAQKAFKYYALLEYAYELLTACANSTSVVHIKCAKEIEYVFTNLDIDINKLFGMVTVMGLSPQPAQPPAVAPQPPAVAPPFNVGELASVVNRMYILFCNIKNSDVSNTQELYDAFFESWNAAVELFYDHDEVLKLNLDANMLSFLSGLKLVQAASISNYARIKTASTLARIFKTVDFGQPCTVAMSSPISDIVKRRKHANDAEDVDEPLLMKNDDDQERVALANFLPFSLRTLEWQDDLGSCDACTSFQCLTGQVSDSTMDSCIRFLSIMHSATVDAIFGSAPPQGLALNVQKTMSSSSVPVQDVKYNKLITAILSMHLIYIKNSPLNAREQFELLVGLNLSNRSMNSPPGGRDKAKSNDQGGTARGGTGGTRKRRRIRRRTTTAKNGQKRTRRRYRNRNARTRAKKIRFD